jgi:hypothetical protein
MSDAPPAPTPEPTPESIWAKPAISVIGLTIFAAGYGLAWLTHDATVQTMYAGAAIAMGQQVIGYWLGSSAGSARKDATIAAAAIAAVPTTPQGPKP